MESIAKIRKALIALVIAAGGAALAALDSASAGGDAITAGEWWFLAGTGLVAAGGVFLTPNALTEAQKARAVAEHHSYQNRAWGSR